MIWPLLLLAAALLVSPLNAGGPARVSRLFAGPAPQPGETVHHGPLTVLCGLAVTLLVATATNDPVGFVVSPVVGVATGLVCRRLLVARSPVTDPLRLAAGWDLLAACLRAGLPVATAVHATADQVPGPAADQLRTIADRLALGADPRHAWQLPDAGGDAASVALSKLARAARRSAHSGTGLASVAQAAARELRDSALDLAAARGQRAGVLITGPLGLCFLPAFLALGVVPVVLGLASGLSAQW